MALHINYSEESNYKYDHDLLRNILEKTLAEISEGIEIEINVGIVGENTMADLHARFMETREVTDVLSFPLVEKSEIELGRGADPDGVLRLGDIVICYEVAEKQARENGRTTDEELAFLAGHGCLHLLGIHHEE